MASEDRHVLITGAGMVGAHSAKTFLDQGWSVTLVDRALQHGYLQDIVGNADRLTTVQVDLSDEVATERALEGLRVDVVVNTAALVAARAQEDAILTVDVNVKMPLSLGQWALRSGAHRLVAISSWGIYAPHQQSRLTEESPIVSPHPSHYGASKAAMEQVLSAFAVDSGLQVVVLRPTIIYGYGPNLGGSIASAIVEDLVLRAAHGEEVLIPSNMPSQSEYTYVGDVAQAVFGAATYDGDQVFEVFNVGSQETTSTEQFAEALRARFPDARVSEAPRDDSAFGPPRQEWATDLTKTLTRLRISPPLTMTDGIAQFESDLRRATHVDQVAPAITRT